MGLAAPAHADVTDPNMLLVTSGVTYESCNDIPFSLKPLSDWGSAQSHAMGNVYGTYNYEVDLKVIGPDGTEASSRTVYRSADDQTQIGDDTGDFFSCDGAGTYVVQASGYWCWVNYTPTTGPQHCQTVAFTKSFSMRAAKTTTTVKPASKTFDMSKSKSLKFVSVLKVERSTGTFAFADEVVALQYRKGTRWVKWDTAYTDSQGKGVFKVRFADPGKFKFRAMTKAGDTFAGSTSPVVTVQVVR